jgi:hypothetical protein
VGDRSTLTRRRSRAFTYPVAYAFVAEEVAQRARNSGLVAEVVPV